MTANRLLSLVLCLSLATLAPGCSDDSGTTPDAGVDMKVKVDQKITKKDKGVDQKVTKKDLGPDQKVTQNEAGPDQKVTGDLGDDQGVSPDVTVYKDQGTVYKDTGLKPDTTTVTPDQGSSTCGLSIAGTITLSSGSGTVNGEVLSSASTSAVNLTSSQCMGQASQGAEKFYAVSLTAGAKYLIKMDPASGYNAGFYVFTNCTSGATVATSCVAGADTKYSGDAEQVTYTPKTSGTYYIGVDSRYSPGSTYSYGKFTISVLELKKPTNDSCTAAKTLTFPSGKTTITEPGLTLGATNNSSLTSSGCTSNTTAGADVFYKLAVVSGKSYTVKVSSSDFNEVVYVFTSCANISGTCSSGLGSDTSTSADESVTFTASKNQTVFIAVDGRAAKDEGTFTLTITEFTAASNDTCTTPQRMTWSGGKATATGDTTTASDRVNFSSTSNCAGTKALGPDLFYAVTLTSGKSYQVKVTPASGYDTAIYVFTDCSNVSSTCVAGDDSAYSGSAESAMFTASSTGTYIIGVDSYSATSSTKAGKFTVEVSEVTLPSNNTCAGATALSFTGGVATATGDNSMATDTVNLPTTGCTSKDTEGGDLFYKANLTAGNGYKVTVTPSSSFNVSAYVLSSCASATTSCVAGADSAYSGSAESFVVSPTTSGTYYFVIDSQYSPGSSLSYGTFTLKIEEVKMPTNNTCAAANRIVLSGGKGQAKGDTTLATGTINLPTTGCTSDDTEGPDLFYAVSLTAGRGYSIKVTPQSGYNVALYLLSSCASPATSCVKGDDSGYSGSAESIFYTPTTSGTYIIGVDTSYAASSSYATGTFTVDVQEFTKPTNDTCGAATPINLSGGKAQISSSNVMATNTVNLPSTGCTGYDTEGGDVFYGMQMTAGKVYKFELAPQSGFNASLYILSSCTSPTTKCVAGADSGSSGSKETVLFTPTTSGTYFVVVDTRYKTGATYSTGTFVLDVSENTKPTNDTCAAAQRLTLSGGKATTTVDTSLATGTLNLPSTGCTKDDTEGPDLFYAVSLTAGQAYRIQAKPQSGYDAAVYLLSTCGTSACVAGADDNSSGSTETIKYTPTASGTYIIGVDTSYSSSSSYATGIATLTVEQYTVASNDTCTNAQALTFVGDVADVTGDTGLATAKTTLSSSSSCASSTAAGPDLFYSFAGQSGYTYQATVSPTDSSYDTLFYVFTSCANPTTTCVAGDDYNYSGEAEKDSFTATSSGTYLLAVDGDSASDQGSFRLRLERFAVPTNTKCSSPKALSWSGGRISETGHTFGTTDEFATVDCGNSNGPWKGGQVYYRVNLTGGKKYRVRALMNDWDGALYAFPAGTTCSATAIDTACASPTTGSQVYNSDEDTNGANELLRIAPTTTGNWIIVVDSYSTSEEGSFTLEIEEDTVPTVTAPFSWNFDAGCQGLSATGDWECGRVSFLGGTNCDGSQIAPKSGHSSYGVWGTKLNDCYSPIGNNASYSSCTNTTPSDDSILSFKVSIPGTWSKATLTYWEWDDTWVPFDWSEIRINGTSVPNSATCNLSSYTAPTAWKKVTVDLTSYIGTTATVAFHFSASTGVNYSGLYIDDISVSGN